MPLSPPWPMPSSPRENRWSWRLTPSLRSSRAISPQPPTFARMWRINESNHVAARTSRSTIPIRVGGWYEGESLLIHPDAVASRTVSHTRAGGLSGSIFIWLAPAPRGRSFPQTRKSAPKSGLPHTRNLIHPRPGHGPPWQAMPDGCPVCSSSRPAVCSRQAAILPPTESREMEAISLASIRCFALTGIVHLITS